MINAKSPFLVGLFFALTATSFSTVMASVEPAPSVNTVIGDQDHKIQVISRGALESMKSNKLKSLLLPGFAKKVLQGLPTFSRSAQMAEGDIPQADSNLLVGFPIGLLGQQNIFGGVITKVSDKTNETLGTLKLTDLPPLHVTTLVTGLAENQPALTLVGCVGNCDEAAEQVPLLSFPIIGIDQSTNTIIVDLAQLGKELNLVEMLDPKGSYTQLKTISSETSSFDFSVSTLVFDVKTKMIPVKADPADATAPVTEFTVRWYLKLTSAFNPAFTPRDPVEGVGFFTTKRNKETKITRFSLSDNGMKIKYYIKNVPESYKPYFANAFDSWNVEFKEIIGRELLAYEFVDAGTPKAASLVPGDIRYNIIEWDLDNVAIYGGLGPSIANQFTGETISANILIQGPTIVTMYTKWFETSKKASALIADGRTSEAQVLMKTFAQEMKAKIAARTAPKFNISLGKHLSMNVRSQTESLADPLIKGDFEIVPAGVTYDSYMSGYIEDMVQHELGHNLGLRHNFRGNLGSNDSMQRGTVSRSVMEYLSRPYRYLDGIGVYDRMAISYGYKGIAPTETTWFCTDEDQLNTTKDIPGKSPECSKADATSDPFSFWEKRLSRTLDLLLNRKSTETPVWKFSELEDKVNDVFTAFLSYAESAQTSGESWTNFFGKAGRPADKSGVKAYVLQSLKAQLCSDAVFSEISSKKTEEGRALAQKNLDELNKKLAKMSKISTGIFAELGIEDLFGGIDNEAILVFSEAELACK